MSRALAVEAQAPLMDEPLSNLDAPLWLQMRAQLKSVLTEAGTTTILCNPRPDRGHEACRSDCCDVPGRIVQEAAPTEVYRRPGSVFVGGFAGSPSMDFLRFPWWMACCGSGFCGYPRPVLRMVLWCLACDRRI